MTITPQKRRSYSYSELEAGKKFIGQGAISRCMKYEVRGCQWVEKELHSWRELEVHLINWIRNEARVLADLRGRDSVVQFLGCYRPRNSWHPKLLTLMLEYIEGESLFDYQGE
ncbi:hypothetical protein J4421_02715 [Candidatus Woesearchaeota archaeon]|nr:hypothetical protein [Candidatus Woesearchaeota archaeon]